MKIEPGQYDDRVRFVAEDGRTMFEVSIGHDNLSLEVRAVDTCRVGGKLFSARLSVEPQVSNVLTIRTRPYE